VLRRYTVTIAGQPRAVEIDDLENGTCRVSVDGRQRQLTVLSSTPTTLTWLDGTEIVHALVDGAVPRLTVSLHEASIPVELTDARAAVPPAGARPSAPAGPVTIRAPIPGRIARVLVKPGVEVAAGGALLVIEAMKMENEIRAPRGGTVREVQCSEGAAVESGQVLVILA
jgi:glutaconyl-CoA decarboxylase